MQKIFSLIIVAILPLGAMAEEFVLKNGRHVSGEVIMRNEKVVILQAENGQRFQISVDEIVPAEPRDNADYTERLASDKDGLQTDRKGVEKANGDKADGNQRKAMIRFEIGGGAARDGGQKIEGGNRWGGSMVADVYFGSRTIKGKEIFIGGGLGYTGLFFPKDPASAQTSYSFLPITAVLRWTLMDKKHAPYVGFQAGYGVALNKAYAGGVNAGFDVGYRYKSPKKASVGLGLYVRMQQANMTAAETIDGTNYTSKGWRTLLLSGVKLTVGL